MSISLVHLFELLSTGDRGALARAITLVESTRPEDADPAEQLIAQALKARRNATVRIGITGIPGVGKSTLIDALGSAMIDRGHRVAVLAVDPSSSVSGGSILGDKTRMARLAANEKAFIRPTAAGGTLGGVARRTKEALLLCEAAGFDRVVVETVGIGQNEVSVDRMVDLNVLLTVAGTGDELQGIKRGIMESADLICVTKADGDGLGRSEQARRDLLTAIALLPPRANGTRPAVLLCSALEGAGVDALDRTIERMAEDMLRSGHLAARRSDQERFWMRQAVEDELLSSFRGDPHVGQRWHDVEELVAAGRMSPFLAARELVALFRKASGPPP